MDGVEPRVPAAQLSALEGEWKDDAGVFELDLKSQKKTASWQQFQREKEPLPT